MRAFEGLIAIAVSTLLTAGLASQTPTDFSGRWTADPAPAAGSAAALGDMGSGWGTTFTITQDANQLVVDPIMFTRYDLQPQPRFVYALDGYLPAPQDANYLAARIDWMNRDGESTPLRATPARWLNPRFAPDGHRPAFAVHDGAQDDVWTYDWSRDALSRLTFDPAADAAPVWTPDASRIVFSSTRHSRYPNLYWQRVDATGDPATD